MPQSKDCVNTQSFLGRNATPIPIFESVRRVLQSIELDPTSDHIINKDVGADRIYTVVDDAYSKPWICKTLFMNPPGETFIFGTREERIFWLNELEKPKKERAVRPSNMTTAYAADWFRKAHREYTQGHIEHAILLLYRSGSIGCLGPLLNYPICITSSDASSPLINGSGRFAFETIEGDKRIAQTSNTQSSAFVLLTTSESKYNLFKEEFKQYGHILEKAK